MQKIKVTIVEDDINYIKYLKKYLDGQGDIDAFLINSFGKEAIKLIIQNNPDVILMDTGLNGDDSAGIDLARILTEEFKLKSKIIMLSSIKDDQIIYNSIIAGAKRCVIKSNIEKIPDIIRCAMGFDPDIVVAEWLQHINHSFLDIKHDLERQIVISNLQKLTHQQLVHLKLILEGKTRNEISSILGISFNTVKNTINSIYKSQNISRNDLSEIYRLDCVEELLKEYDNKN